MSAYEIKIECEEDGFHIVIDGDSIDPDYQAGEYGWKIEDPEQLYDRVNATIGPWLQEREAAFAEFRHQRALGAFRCDPDESAGYDPSDPKHPDWHSVHADLWDSREGK